MSHFTGLIADIGATNARFALVDGGRDGVPSYRDERVLKCADYPDIVSAIQVYLDGIGVAPSTLRRGAFAVAGPVLGDAVHMTNHPWSFSIAGVRDALGVERLAVVNDFYAVALGVPHLGGDDLREVGGPVVPRPHAPIAIIGPGTGLGVAALVWDGARYIPVPGEGGHVTIAARTQREFDVIQALHGKYRHISAERVCSGKGVVNLYRALCSLDGRNDLPERSAEEISAAAMAGTDPVAVEALDMMLGFLGIVAGNLALTLGAFGGVYLAGGICQQLGNSFFDSRFRQEFEAKGRFDEYLKQVPTYLILHKYVAFLGLAAEIGQERLFST